MDSHPPRAILTDIEGTTSSISFVKDVLFPYAREHLPGYVRTHAQEPSVRRLLDDASTEAGGGLDDDQVIEQLLRWIDEDRKVTPLKALQGLIWAAGYRNGDFTGHMYDDAVRNLRAWHDAGIALYVYSSGSVKAQQLLFAHTDHGDLTPLFSGYFDTRVGGKKETDSYRAIAQEIAVAPGDILFLSDIAEELDAARAAGLDTCQLVRAAEVIPAAGHHQVTNFDELATGGA